VNKLLLPLKMFFADGPYTHEDEYGRHPGFVVFSCCSEIVDKPHAADCSWFNLLKYFEQAVNEGKPTPGQIGLVETEIARWLWSLQRQPRLKGDPAITQGLCEQIALLIESGRFSVTGQGQEERDEELQTAIGEVFRAALPHVSKLSHLFPELSTALDNLEVARAASADKAQDPKGGA
jgi:hypothetical protein